ncbi:probable protein phosphatase 2C 55 [Rutidosis leptorrhynchoides]|uniref:probable protein phosphatase 2C 55 n=1 Tax=Rutidosis leptorrhynchoides TaxID=125765 RepID=UPI003A98D9B7
MPYKYFSKLRGPFTHGIRRTNISLEANFHDSVEVLLDHGQLLFGKPRFYSGPFVASGDLNILLQRFTPCAAQLNLQPANKKKNLSVIGAVSRTFSTPSVFGPSFQVCEYHVDNLLSGPSQFSPAIDNRKMPIALSGSRALLGSGSLNYSTKTRENLTGSIGNSNISYGTRGFHSCSKICMNSRNKEQSGSFSIYGYFIYHVARTSGNCNPLLGFQCKSFHVSVPEFLTGGSASDVFSDDSVCDDQHTKSANSSVRKTISDRPLKLVSGSCYLPHPEKEETGGEDAHFICRDEQAIGVADGVGGWADLGIDAGKYARELMNNSVSAVQDEPKGSVDPARVLEKAYTKTKAQGSSTACIIALSNQGLNAINLGDSGFMIVRHGCTIFRSPAQQHDFNFTYQLENASHSDLPSSGQVFSISVAPGDVIIAGTDGLFDNLYNNDITAIVVHAVRAGLEPQVTAQKIAALARQRALERDRQTPFSAAAQEAGFRYYGGKLDDITVVVSYITSSNDDKSSSSTSS